MTVHSGKTGPLQGPAPRVCWWYGNSNPLAAEHKLKK